MQAKSERYEVWGHISSPFDVIDAVAVLLANRNRGQRPQRQVCVQHCWGSRGCTKTVWQSLASVMSAPGREDLRGGGRRPQLDCEEGFLRYLHWEAALADGHYDVEGRRCRLRVAVSRRVLELIFSCGCPGVSACWRPWRRCSWPRSYTARSSRRRRLWWWSERCFLSVSIVWYPCVFHPSSFSCKGALGNRTKVPLESFTWVFQ